MTVIFDAPEVELLSKLSLIICIFEFWIDFSIISKVIYQCLKRLSIPVQEYAIVDLFEVVHASEHFLERGALDGGKDFLADHDFVSAANVEVDDFGVEAVLRQNQPLFLFPRLLLRLNFIELDFQLFLSVLILHRYHIMILLNRFIKVSELF